MNKQMEWMIGWMDGQTDGQKDKWLGKWMNEQVGEWMDGIKRLIQSSKGRVHGQVVGEIKRDKKQIKHLLMQNILIKTNRNKGPFCFANGINY